MKYCLVLFLCIGFYTIGWGQEGKKSVTGLVIGNVLDSSGSKGLQGISVMMSGLNDTSNIHTVISDKNGAFEISGIRFGYYRVSFSGIGFSTLNIDSIHVREERYDFNLGDIHLKPQSTEMQEVVIYAEKPLIETKDDKIIYNVGESALSAGASTSEMLKNMPLISNDASGKILLKGKEPKILIDDKPTELNAQQLSDLLESLPGNSIERIEMMTNPPSQYAGESGGVINIITKKGKIGWTGTLNASYGTRGELNFSGNLSYRHKKLNINITGGAGAGRYTGYGESMRQNFYRDSSNFFQTYNTSYNKSARPNLRVNADYDFNKQQQINIVGNFNSSFFDNESETNYKNINRFNNVYKWSVRGNETNGQSLNPSLSATYTYKGKNPREVLRVIGAYSNGQYANDRVFNQLFLNPDKTLTGVDSTQRQQTFNTSDAWSLRLNYDKPLSKKLSFSTGGYLGRSIFHNRLQTDLLKKPDNVFEIAPGLSQDFHFYQSIYNGRAGFTYDMNNKWRIIAALQAEVTNIRFAFPDMQDNIKNEYTNWLPNFTLRKEWKGGWSSSVVYRKSIRRPGTNELNPSVDFNDPYNLRFGNPQLLPQLAHNFDWNAGWYKGKMYANLSFGYNYVKDIIQSIRTLVPGDKTQITYNNITDRREYEASIWGGYTFSKKLRINASAGFTHNEYSEYDRRVNKYRNGNTIYTTLNYHYTFTDRISVDGNIRYSTVADAQGRSRSNVNQNIGLQTKWLNKRLTVSVNFIDFISRQQYTSYTYGSNFTLQSTSSARSKNLRVAAVFYLKKPPAKYKPTNPKLQQYIKK